MLRSHSCSRICANSASLLGKWLYTVRLDTPALAAIWSMLVAANPDWRNSATAASTMAARLRSVRRDGAGRLDMPKVYTGGFTFRNWKLHCVVYFLRTCS